MKYRVGKIELALIIFNLYEISIIDRWSFDFPRRFYIRATKYRVERIELRFYLRQLFPISTKYRSSTIDQQTLKIDRFFIPISYISNEISNRKNWTLILLAPIICIFYEILIIDNWSSIFENQPIFHTDFVHKQWNIK